MLSLNKRKETQVKALAPTPPPLLPSVTTLSPDFALLFLSLFLGFHRCFSLLSPKARSSGPHPWPLSSLFYTGLYATAAATGHLSFQSRLPP